MLLVSTLKKLDEPDTISWTHEVGLLTVCTILRAGLRTGFAAYFVQRLSATSRKLMQRHLPNRHNANRGLSIICEMSER